MPKCPHDQGEREKIVYLRDGKDRVVIKASICKLCGSTVGSSTVRREKNFYGK